MPACAASQNGSQRIVAASSSEKGAQSMPLSCSADLGTQKAHALHAQCAQCASWCVSRHHLCWKQAGAQFRQARLQKAPSVANQAHGSPGRRPSSANQPREPRLLGQLGLVFDIGHHFEHSSWAMSSRSPESHAVTLWAGTVCRYRMGSRTRAGHDHSWARVGAEVA